MDWNMLADAFSHFMQVTAVVFLIYGLVLAVTSVIPERYLRGWRREAPSGNLDTPQQGEIGTVL